MFAIRDPLLILYMAVALLLSLSIHEASHAAVADFLGDDGPRKAGRLTLNPIAHLDPAGALVLVISSLAGFGIGWGKPVPVSPWKLQRGFLKNLPNGPLVGMGIVALAGPISNLILAAFGVHILADLPVPATITDNWLRFVETWVIVNVVLAIFNMIPIPPLDGSRVLMALLPTNLGFRFARLEGYGPGLLILLVFLLPSVLQSILSAASGPVLRMIGAF
jgi:Zn-dependent protease